jgi:hypothetical protein
MFNLAVRKETARLLKVKIMKRLRIVIFPPRIYFPTTPHVITVKVPNHLQPYVHKISIDITDQIISLIIVYYLLPVMICLTTFLCSH